MGVAALVLGIIAIVLDLFGAGIVGAILALIGVILGALGRKNPEKKGIATAGLVLSIIGLILGLLFYILCASCLASAGLAF